MILVELILFILFNKHNYINYFIYSNMTYQLFKNNFGIK